MRVLCEDALFAPSADPGPLIELLLACDDGRHLLELCPVRAPCFADWLQQRSPADRERLQPIHERGLRELALSGERRTLRVGDPSRQHELSLAQALRLLRQPLEILVENERRDGAFLRAVVPTARRDDFERALRSQWLRFSHGGGLGEIHALIKGELRDPQMIFVVFDSDACAPGAPSRDAQKVDALCEQRAAPRHRLRRRASENYLPRPALALWIEEHKGGDRGQRKRHRQFCDLSDEQRHHYHMKRGLRGDGERAVLFQQVTQFTRDALHEGFGDDVGDVFGHVLARGAAWSGWHEWLSEDGQDDEMQPLFDRILAQV